MQKANLVLRYLSVTQVSIVMSCLIMNAIIDIFMFRKAKLVGGIVWGKMPVRSQYALILLCVVIVILMGLMGFIRSGLRMDWHIYGVLQDTSPMGIHTDFGLHGADSWFDCGAIPWFGYLCILVG